MIRDTELYDDMGGGGQRIYTTAGRGYPLREYIRADVTQASRELQVEVERLQHDLQELTCGDERYTRLGQDLSRVEDLLRRSWFKSAASEPDLQAKVLEYFGL